MKQELLARRQQSESAFSALQTSIQSIEVELNKYGVESIDAAREELARLQGEYRVIGELLDNLSIEKSKKTSKADEADTIDITDVKGA